MLEARLLNFVDDVVDRETRYTHVGSARRCLSDLDGGWWTTFELPAELQNNVTEIVDSGGADGRTGQCRADPRRLRALDGRPVRRGRSRAAGAVGGVVPARTPTVWARRRVWRCRPTTATRVNTRSSCVPTKTSWCGVPVGRVGRFRGWRSVSTSSPIIGCASFVDDETRAVFTEIVGMPTWRDPRLPHGSSVPSNLPPTRSPGVSLATRTPVTDSCRLPPARSSRPGTSCSRTARPLTTCGEKGWSQ